MTNLISVGFTLYFAHHFQKIEFATLAIFNLFLAATNIFSSLGLETHCIREIPKHIENDEKKIATELITVTLISRFLMAVVLVGVFCILSIPLAKVFYKTSGFSNAVKFIGIGALLGTINVSFELIGQSIKAFRAISWIKPVNALSYSIAALLLYWQWGFAGWLYGFCFFRITGIILFIISFRSWFGARINRHLWLASVKRSYPFYLRGFMRFGLLHLDQLIIGITMSPATMATYFVAKRIANYINFIIEAISRPAIVEIVKLNTRSLTNAATGLEHVGKLNCIVFIPVIGTIIALARPILEIYGGAKYLDAYPLLIILSFGTLATAILNGIYTRGVFVIGKPSDTLRVDAVGCLVNTILLLILSYYFNVYGVAVASVISILAASYFSKLLLSKYVKIRFPAKLSGKLAAASMLSVLFVLGIQNWYYDYKLILVYLLIFGIMFVAISAVTLNADEKIIYNELIAAKLR